MLARLPPDLQILWPYMCAQAWMRHTSVHSVYRVRDQVQAVVAYGRRYERGDAMSPVAGFSTDSLLPVDTVRTTDWGDLQRTLSAVGVAINQTTGDFHLHAISNHLFPYAAHERFAQAESSALLAALRPHAATGAITLTPDYPSMHGDRTPRVHLAASHPPHTRAQVRQLMEQVEWTLLPVAEVRLTPAGVTL